MGELISDENKQNMSMPLSSTSSNKKAAPRYRGPDVVDRYLEHILSDVWNMATVMQKKTGK